MVIKVVVSIYDRYYYRDDNARQARHEPFDGHGRTYIKALVDEELLERGARRVNGDLPEFRDADQWRAWIIAKLAAIHN